MTEHLFIFATTLAFIFAWGLGLGWGHATLSGPALLGWVAAGLGHPGRGLLHGGVQRVLGLGRAPAATPLLADDAANDLGGGAGRYVWVPCLGQASVSMHRWHIKGRHGSSV